LIRLGAVWSGPAVGLTLWPMTWSDQHQHVAHSVNTEHQTQTHSANSAVAGVLSAVCYVSYHSAVGVLCLWKVCCGSVKTLNTCLVLDQTSTGCSAGRLLHRFLFW